jgi:hypothetical protein
VKAQTIRKGVAPEFARPFGFVVIDLEAEPLVRLLAPNLVEAARLQLWLSSPAVRERLVESVRMQLAQLVGAEDEEER